MSSPVRTYKVYCFDRAHQELTSDLIEATSDEEAIAAAEVRGFGSIGELWDGNRLVAKLGAERRQA
jgi:hypothetical protein